MLTCIFMYLDSVNLVSRYVLFTSKYPNPASGVDMTLFTRILVVSNPDVYVLFFPMYSNLFPPAVSLVLLGSYFCGRIYATNIVYFTVLCLGTSFFLVDYIELIPLMRSFSFLSFQCLVLIIYIHWLQLLPKPFVFMGFGDLAVVENLEFGLLCHPIQHEHNVAEEVQLLLVVLLC